MEGREFAGGGKRRTLIVYILIAGTTAVFIVLATAARVPRMDMHLPWAAALAAAMLGLLLSCGITLWRTTPVSNAYARLGLPPARTISTISFRRQAGDANSSV